MRITNEKLEITPSEIILWEDLKTMRLLNEKLILVLNDNRTIELSHVLPSTVDLAFRTYEKFLSDHPEKRKSS
jgi:hypothetical protein